MALGVAAA